MRSNLLTAPGLTVVEVNDWKSTSSPQYAKTGPELRKTIQMMSYGKWATHVFPTATHVRLTHTYFLTVKPKNEDQPLSWRASVLVPRATYTGWNPRAAGFGPTAFYPLQGAVLPFAPTEAARKDANDPRPSIEARYGDDAAYVAAVKREAAHAVAERLLLEEDAVRSIEAAKQGTLAKLGQ